MKSFVVSTFMALMVVPGFGWAACMSQCFVIDTGPVAEFESGMVLRKKAPFGVFVTNLGEVYAASLEELAKQCMEKKEAYVDDVAISSFERLKRKLELVENEWHRPEIRPGIELIMDK